MGDFDQAIRQQREDVSKLAVWPDLDLVRAILDIQREMYELTGCWPNAGEVLSRLMRGPQ